MVLWPALYAHFNVVFPLPTAQFPYVNWPLEKMIYTLTTSIRWLKKCLNDSNLPAAMTRQGKWLKLL